jgi:hypothetical protein
LPGSRGESTPALLPAHLGADPGANPAELRPGRLPELGPQVEQQRGAAFPADQHEAQLQLLQESRAGHRLAESAERPVRHRDAAWPKVSRAESRGGAPGPLTNRSSLRLSETPPPSHLWQVSPVARHSHTPSGTSPLRLSTGANSSSSPLLTGPLAVLGSPTSKALQDNNNTMRQSPVIPFGTRAVTLPEISGESHERTCEPANLDAATLLLRTFVTITFRSLILCSPFSIVDAKVLFRKIARAPLFPDFCSRNERPAEIGSRRVILMVMPHVLIRDHVWRRGGGWGGEILREGRKEGRR